MCWNWDFILEEIQAVPGCGEGLSQTCTSLEEANVELRPGGSSCWLGPPAEDHRALAPEGMGLHGEFLLSLKGKKAPNKQKTQIFLAGMQEKSLSASLSLIQA